MQLFYAPEIEHLAQLPADEAKHCLKILRHIVGDIIRVTDGKGFFYECEILNSKDASLKIIRKEKDPNATTHSLHIAVAPTKSGERTDWMIEKLIEFGIGEITFIDCDHSERTKINLERCERIAISAMKQSLKSVLPKINPLISFKKFMEMNQGNDGSKLIAHCDESGIKNEIASLTLLPKTICCIGPEGDFSKEEIILALKHQFVEVALGASRLRTETAALAVGTYYYFNQSKV